MKINSISEKPTKKQLAEIEKWLIEERNLTGDGFYCNWEIIKSSHKNDKILTISASNTTVGFATWSITSDHTATIEIVEIHPNYRKKGLCKYLISYLFKLLIDKSIYVVSLECSPISSEPFWRHLEFIDFPEENIFGYWNNGCKKLYKILTPYSQETTIIDDSEFIQLWDNEPNRSRDIKPTWSWKLEFKNGSTELINPIIHPCIRDWKIRWIDKGKTIKEDKIKYLFKDEIDFGSFLIITHLTDKEPNEI